MPRRKKPKRVARRPLATQQPATVHASDAEKPESLFCGIVSCYDGDQSIGDSAPREYAHLEPRDEAGEALAALARKVEALEAEVRDLRRDRDLKRGLDGGGATGSVPPRSERDAEACERDAEAGEAERDGGGKVEVDSDDDSGDDDQEELQASMWSVALIAFTEPVGFGASCLLVLLLGFNVFIQVFFLYIVIENLTESQVDDSTIRSLKTWRFNVAHNAEYYDDRSRQSLARRVCDGDAGLETSAAQAVQYESFARYAGASLDASPFAPGPCMCFVALVVWVLTIAGETNDAWAHARALFHAPAGPRTLVVEGEDGASFSSVSRGRKVAAGAVLVVRVVVCGFLAYYGGVFLAVTIDIETLLLNTVALEFVLGVDELIFSSLAPAAVQAYVDGFAGLAVPKARSWRGLDARSLATLAAAFGAVLYFVFLVVLPQTRDIVDARDALCAGDRDFVYATDGFGVPVWGFPPGSGDAGGYRERNYPDGGDVPYAADEFNLGSNYGSFGGATVEALLRQLGRVPNDDCCYGDGADAVCGYGAPPSACTEDDGSPYGKPRDDAPGCCLVQKTAAQDVVGTDYSVATKAAWSVEKAVAIWNPMCYDALDLGLPYNQLLAAAIGDTVDSAPCGGCPPNAAYCDGERCVTPLCADVAAHCAANTQTGIRARQLCPQTCGCNDPRSPLALFDGAAGCGDQCTRSGVYRSRLDELPCEDVARDDPAFVAFLDDFAAVAATWPSDWAGGGATWVGIFRNLGCDALDGDGAAMGVPAYLFGANSCVEDGWWFGVKPMSYWCPVACGCYAGDPHCPTSCPARNGSEPDCPPYQKRMANSFPESTTCALAVD